MCLLALLLAYHVFSGSNGIKMYVQKKKENRGLQQDIEQLRRENDELADSVRSLKSNPQTIEKEAREQLKYAKPGEVIYVLPEQASKPPANATAQQHDARKP
jgi:cell division protein FtsB